jgi:hypothetical protein
VSGRVKGGKAPAAVALAINGRIAATSPTFRTLRSGPTWFAGMVPPSAFRAGANSVQVYAVSGSSAAPRLRKLS